MAMNDVRWAAVVCFAGTMIAAIIAKVPTNTTRDHDSDQFDRPAPTPRYLTLNRESPTSETWLLTPAPRATPKAQLKPAEQSEAKMLPPPSPTPNHQESQSQPIVMAATPPPGTVRYVALPPEVDNPAVDSISDLSRSVIGVGEKSMYVYGPTDTGLAVRENERIVVRAAGRMVDVSSQLNDGEASQSAALKHKFTLVQESVPLIWRVGRSDSWSAQQTLGENAPHSGELFIDIDGAYQQEHHVSATTPVEVVIAIMPAVPHLTLFGR